MEYVTQALLPTRHGEFTVHTWTDGESTPTALVAGTLTDGALVRIHSGCLTGDAFGSLRCDCGEQFDKAMAAIQASGNGILIYLSAHEGRGIGFANKMRAYALQDQGFDTITANHQLGFPTDARDYSAAVHILRHFGLSHIRLLTNNPDKIGSLTKEGIAVMERLPLAVASNPHNASYLKTKRDVLGHFLLQESDTPAA